MSLAPHSNTACRAPSPPPPSAPARLSAPTAAHQRHSRRLSAHIRAHIARAGWVGFDEFMHQALYAPGLGYYSAGLPKFGRGGDFITAPHLGDVFARCLAKQCAEALAEIGHGDVLEFGGGDGRLAADMLAAFAAMEAGGGGATPERYFILETSADLRARQRATLDARGGRLLERVHWLDELPDGFTGVAFANEVLDAMPALRFETDAHGRAHALGVALDDNGEFGWASADEPLPERLQSRLAHLSPSAGYRGEMGLRAEAWVRTVGERLTSGVLLLLDYGFPRHEYYHPQRRDGTLMCHYRHRAHDDPFFYPGLQDISVHVDFTAVAQAAGDAGLSLAGYASQGAFLLSLGALEMPQARSGEINTLTLPHEMGELFKVIAFTRNYAAPLSGFALKDRRGAL